MRKPLKNEVAIFEKKFILLKNEVVLAIFGNFNRSFHVEVIHLVLRSFRLMKRIRKNMVGSVKAVV